MTEVMSHFEKQRASVYQYQNPYAPTQNSNEVKVITNPLGPAKLWNTPNTKTQLKESIQQKMDQGKLPKRSSINEKMLIQEYWTQWLNIDEKDFQNQLLKHPGLTENDYQGVNNLITRERARQFYWSCGMSLFTYGIYHLALKKKARFYNFFKKRSQYRIVNYTKTFMGGLTLLWSWIIGMNYFYEQKIPTDLAKKGYYKNYKIIFEPVYI